MRFDALGLSAGLLKNLAEEGYAEATPIQAAAIPEVLAGRDVMGCAQTGTGKTAAFALPILEGLMRGRPWGGGKPKGKDKGKRRANGGGASRGASGGKRAARCLVLCPTRELATQITAGFKTYGRGSGLMGVTVYGGVNQKGQVRDLRSGVDVIIATPGRLMDLMEQGHVDLRQIQTLVLDEADRMLDMGFIHDIRKIAAELPPPESGRQTLMFSATMQGAIRTLADQLLREPVVVEIEPERPTAEGVEQSVYFVDREGKPDLLAQLMEGMHRTIVFVRTKHGADKLVRKLREREIKSESIHGNKTQNARQRTLQRFREDKVAVLVATDVAARGIDVDGVSHVVNYDLTHEPETYVHRIGRTARAGNAGVAVSLCSKDEVGWLRAIERLLGSEIEAANGVPGWARDGQGGGGGLKKGKKGWPKKGTRGAGASKGGGKRKANRGNRGNAGPGPAKNPSKKGKHRKGKPAAWKGKKQGEKAG
ncbi:MAG: DEAD/DEAH box helicase [Planctomycetota bacterium]